MAKSILIVEDDDSLREALLDALEIEGISAVAARNGQEAINLIEKNNFSLIVTDVNMPEIDGITLLRILKQRYNNIPVILITAYGNVNHAVEAMQLGAIDYLAKPFEPRLLIEKIDRYAVELTGKNPVAVDPSSKELFSLALRVSNTDATVLITGESGSGKEVLARFIHDSSLRKDQPFIAVNCAAIPENMLESTLFGYEKGAFTGAIQSMPGKFEQAQNGTILLDEISEMALPLQAKLLRVIQEREVERLGGKKIINLNVRLIATSNRDLKDCVQKNLFREDLYYRLNVFPLHWQPLRDRPLDILPLAEYLLGKYAQNYHHGVIPKFSEDAKKALVNCKWSGNVREMENVIQRALILSQGDFIKSEDLNLMENTNYFPEKIIATAVADQQTNNLKDREYHIILEALAACDGNKKKTAETLGISPRTLRYKLAQIRDLGIRI